MENFLLNDNSNVELCDILTQMLPALGMNHVDELIHITQGENGFGCREIHATMTMDVYNSRGAYQYGDRNLYD